LDFVVEYLDKLGVSQVITAALFKKPSSTAKVDHWAETTSAWIIFAYEAIETMKELAAKWQKQGITDEEIKHRFIEIGFDQEDIDLYRQSRQVADRA
jgi:hypoxanthine phosphoribosyltransferase